MEEEELQTTVNEDCIDDLCEGGDVENVFQSEEN